MCANRLNKYCLRNVLVFRELADHQLDDFFNRWLRDECIYIFEFKAIEKDQNNFKIDDVIKMKIEPTDI